MVGGLVGCYLANTFFSRIFSTWPDPLYAHQRGKRRTTDIFIIYSNVSKFHLYSCFYFIQGKGERLTYFLTAEDKTQRLKRIKITRTRRSNQDPKDEQTFFRPISQGLHSPVLSDGSTNSSPCFGSSDCDSQGQVRHENSLLRRNESDMDSSTSCSIRSLLYDDSHDQGDSLIINTDDSTTAQLLNGNAKFATRSGLEDIELVWCKSVIKTRKHLFIF